MYWTAIDVEATGGSKQDRVIQVGVAVFCDFYLISTWSLYLRPEPWRPSIYYAQVKHNIAEDHLRRSPPFTLKVWKRLAPYLKGTVIAHNISAEKRFLVYELAHLLGLRAQEFEKLTARDWERLAKRAKKEKNLDIPLKVDWICTSRMTQDVVGAKMPNLKEACRLTQTPYNEHQHHDALWDAVTCGQIYGRLLQLQDKKNETLPLPQ